MAVPLRIYDGFLPGLHAIDSYGAGGFRFAGMSHKGSLLLLPDGIHRWSAAEGSPLSLDDLAPVLVHAGAIDVFLIGTGSMPRPLSEPARALLREHGLRFDIMTTSSAAMTFNVLLQENRRVAAGLVATN
jgi:uncharacterized protein